MFLSLIANFMFLNAVDKSGTRCKGQLCNVLTCLVESELTAYSIVWPFSSHVILLLSRLSINWDEALANNLSITGTSRKVTKIYNQLTKWLYFDVQWLTLHHFLCAYFLKFQRQMIRINFIWSWKRAPFCLIRKMEVT